MRHTPRESLTGSPNSAHLRFGLYGHQFCCNKVLTCFILRAEEQLQKLLDDAKKMPPSQSAFIVLVVFAVVRYQGQSKH